MRKKQLVFHKYERFYWPSGKPYYRCMLPGCSHYFTLASMVIGKESLCWGPQCNRLVTITAEDIRKDIKHPMCEQCKQERQERREQLMRTQ